MRGGLRWRRLSSRMLSLGLAGSVALCLAATWQARSDQERAADAAARSVLLQAREDFLAREGRATPADLQRFVEDLCVGGDFAYCAVVSGDGTYAAHSAPDRVGHRADPSQTIVPDAAAVERVRFLEGGPPSATEYLLTLGSGENQVGVLVAGLGDESTATNWEGLLTSPSAAVLAPLLVFLVGGFVLERTAGADPLREIEGQLHAARAARPSSRLPLAPVEGVDPTALGWNRVVDELTGRSALGNLEERLSQALGGFRQQKLERALNSLPDGIAVTDAKGSILLANRALGALLGANDPAGRAITDLLPVSDGADAEAVRGQLSELSRPVVVELQRSEEAGDSILRVARYPVAVEDGGSVNYVWSVRDVTQQKLADDMRTQFVYAATHELRTPLANIKAYAETLALDDLISPEQQKGFLNTINSEATRLARFVDELLNISRMEAGALSLDRQETDFARLLSEVVQKIRPQMEQKCLAFETRLPAKLPKLQIDKDKVAASIINLLGNAAKYTPEAGRVVLHVEAGPRELQIHVEDSGIGISAEELPKVFEKFFRSSDARVQEVTGTGLGLSFVQEVARLHGGKVLVHSELNKGSRFTLVLPAR